MVDQGTNPMGDGLSDKANADEYFDGEVGPTGFDIDDGDSQMKNE